MSYGREAALCMENGSQASLHEVVPGERMDAAKTKRWFPFSLPFAAYGGPSPPSGVTPRPRRCLLWRGLLVLTGTIFYWRTEDWTFIQALYFSVVTLTTVGYGDLHPTSAGTQIFTIIYILTGLGVFVALLALVAEQYIKQKSEGGGVRERVRSRRGRSRPAEDTGPQ
jgi:voltage-gated potassium channel